MASSKAKSVASAPSAQPAPRPISTMTVASMVQLCEYMFRPQGPFGDPLFDVTKLATLLFGMGFSRDFLEKCEWEYHWNFAALFPALYDGGFYGLGSYGQSRGQGDLRGFATFLCGMFSDNPRYRNDYFDAFERNLSRDGYNFVGRQLVETSTDTSVPATLGEPPVADPVSVAPSGGENQSPTALGEDQSPKVSKWGRVEKIAAWTLFFGVLAAVANWLVVPELRSWLHLDGRQVMPGKPSQPEQTIYLAGTVVDANSNRPVPQAHITVSGRTEGYVTEDNGNFRIPFIAKPSDLGDLRIRVTKSGYRVYDESVTPPTTSLIIQLQRK